MFSTRSLTFRVAGLSTILAIAALFAIATIISTLYQNRAERDFENILNAHLETLIGAVGLNENGKLRSEPNLVNRKFGQPESVLYWEVTLQTEANSDGLRSASMKTGKVESPSIQEVPFSIQEVPSAAKNYKSRTYVADGPAREKLRVVEAEILIEPEIIIEAKDLEDAEALAEALRRENNKEAVRYRFMGNLASVDQDTTEFRNDIYLYLALFAAAMVVINAGAILFGMRPLGRIRAALTDIREGRVEKLGGEFPPEIEPLVRETNALIDNNRKIVERYRTQVGNLAHSLKTPLAVITNEGRSASGGRGTMIVGQAAAMKRQIDHTLQRARIAAQRDTVIYRTGLSGPMARMVRVLGKLNPDKTFALDLPASDPVFAGEKEDLEEIVGNLLENAAKWARGNVAVTVAEIGEGHDSPTVSIAIEDDGPGIPADRAADAIKRGGRLDESRPGTGLGLAIVVDLAAEYGGSLNLEQSRLGGLRAVVHLPGGG